MATTTTPNLSLTLAVPGSNEPFDTADVNANFTAIDTEVGVRRSADTSLDARLDAVEPYLLPSYTPASSARFGLSPAGSTADRNAFWSVPADATARVALAGRQARWWNTDLGYEQQYFAQFDDAGVTATTPVRPTHGWMPARRETALSVFTLVGGTPANVSKRGDQVVLTGTSATIALDAVFTDQFNDYQIELDIPTGGPAADVRLQARLSGATVTGGTYAYNRLESTNVNTVVGERLTAQTQFVIGRCDTTGSRVSCRLSGPQTTRRTTGFAESVDSQVYQRRMALFHDTTAAHDGFILSLSTGNFPTGTRVFVTGIRD